MTAGQESLPPHLRESTVSFQYSPQYPLVITLTMISDPSGFYLLPRLHLRSLRYYSPTAT